MKNLFQKEEFARKILPFIREDYFHEKTEKVVFQEIQKFILKYNKIPSYESVRVELSNRPGLIADEFQDAVAVIDEVKNNDDVSDEQWLLESAEKFCQEKAIHNAILESIHILDGSNKQFSKGAIPSLLTDALSVSFDPYVGHDYIDNAEKRYEFYHRTEKRIPFDLEYMNKITRGGLPRKTLSCILAGTGVGKSLFMCHMAASALTENLNVLYITMEMAEERIAERIDANLLNVRVDELETMPKDIYLKKIRNLESKTKGKLIIKEYPTASASSAHFRALLNDLALKRNFTPDVIFIDYMNICASSRLKHGSNVNSYSYIKAIAEELRGLAVEFDVPVVTATQTTRSGFSNSDPGMEDISESFGTAATVDFMISIVATEQLDAVNQILVKQLKNRFSDPSSNKRFVLGIDRARMRLYDVAQTQIADSGQDEPPPQQSYKPMMNGHGDKYEKFKNFSFD